MAKSNKVLDLNSNLGKLLQIDTDFVRTTVGGLRGQFWSVWASCADDTPVQTALEQIDVVKQLATQYGNHVQFVTTAADARAAVTAGRLASFIGVEGGHMMNNSLAVLRQLHALGARYMTLTHSCSTGWAESSVNENLGGVNAQLGLDAVPRVAPYASVRGLTAFGRQVVREMNRLGMIVDLSHVSSRTMHDALDVTLAPVLFSHSSARNLTNHTRNVPDDVLAHVQRNGGVVSVNFFCLYVSSQAAALYASIQNRLNYGAAQLGNDTSAEDNPNEPQASTWSAVRDE
jgi:membrane dipeptidase